MASFNKTILVGNLTKDAELKETKSKKKCATFTLAVSEKSGEEEHTDFIDVCFLGKSTENVVKYLTKGKSVLVEGSIYVNRYEDKNKIKREKYQIRSYDLKLLSPAPKKEGAVENIDSSDSEMPF